jgi:pyruvate dehydrogenase E2 component (dihydrolipoamide acetyltransferase)
VGVEPLARGIWGSRMDVLMPQLGETVTEGKISAWFKRVGEPVAPGDNLFEIETDKVSMEVPAVSAGVLQEIRVPVGEVAPVGGVVAVIGTAAGAQVSPLPSLQKGAGQGEGQKLGESQAAAPHPEPSPRERRGEAETGRQPRGNGAAPRSNGKATALDPFFEVRTPARNFGPARLPGGATVTPLARRLAAEAGLDVKQVKGSGPHGRITARDVEQATAAKPATAAAAPAVLARGRSAEQIKALYRETPFEEVPLDNMRRTIAARLVEAKQTIPHFYLSMDVGLGRLLKLREKLNAAGGEDAPAHKLSVNDFVIKALAVALQRVPAANAVWAEDRILRFKHADIGVAVALEGGLITPVIRHAETKSLSAISSEMRDLAARARERRLRPEEYQGGATTISNLGMYGVREFSGIINPPHGTLLAVGAAERRPVETKKGRVKFASAMTVTLSCDHRVVDGALGAQLLAALKGLLERPLTALV